jgi:hypothetical protein
VLYTAIATVEACSVNLLLPLLLATAVAYCVHLATTIVHYCFVLFNTKNSVWMVGAFTVQLFTKTFHWLAQARVEHVGRTEGTTIVQHLKLFALQVSHSDMYQHYAPTVRFFRHKKHCIQPEASKVTLFTSMLLPLAFLHLDNVC